MALGGAGARLRAMGGAQGLRRRQLLGGLGALATSAFAGPAWTRGLARPGDGQRFEEVPAGLDGALHLPPGYTADVIAGWGDPLGPGEALDPRRMDDVEQGRRFGYNCDFTAVLPLGRDRLLLFVNHEYTDPQLMFPGIEGDADPRLSLAQIRVELAAHGASILELERHAGGWRRVDGPLARRIRLDRTEIELSGPAAGDLRLRTRRDPSGRLVVGTLCNCGGGVTPWGTILTAEENIDEYFWGTPRGPEADNHRRFGLGLDPGRQFGRHLGRFDLEHEPHEPNRFGWMVEIDPLDPQARPIKRTALGRFKHEGAAVTVAADGRVVVYMADDQSGEHLYRFVSDRPIAGHAAARRHLLDHGELSVARLDDDGTGCWLPLVFGRGPLTRAAGFRSMADVLIDARFAADLLGATALDRPEGVAVQPGSGRVYAMLNGARREPGAVTAAHPRAPNPDGHVLELSPLGGDAASSHFAWQVFLLGGPPERGGRYGAGTTPAGWISMPDNCAIDPGGRLWIASDMSRTAPLANALWVMETDGRGRAVPRAFARGPAGAELTGPSFTADGRTLFLSVQHPGDTLGATYEAPGARWPDEDPSRPPRPAVVAIRRLDGRALLG